MPPRPPPLDPEAFARLFEESSEVLWTLAAGVVGERSLADDVLQEACLIALGKLDRFEPGTSFRAWMGQIVRFVGLNQVRKRRARPLEEPDALAATPARTGDARGVDGDGREPQRHELLDARGDADLFDDEVVAALATLSSTARACLLLRVVHEMDYRSLGAFLGLPEGTAMSHVHRARRALQERLGGARSAAPRAATESATRGAARTQAISPQGGPS